MVGDISGETAEVEGTVEDSLQLSGKLHCMRVRTHSRQYQAWIHRMYGGCKVGRRDFYQTGKERAYRASGSDRLEAFTAAVAEESEEKKSVALNNNHRTALEY